MNDNHDFPARKPEPCNVLPQLGRDLLVWASQAPAPQRIKAIDDATAKVRRLYPEFFKQHKEL